MRRAFFVSVAVCAACGPSKRDGNGDTDGGPQGPFATVVGQVYAPNHGPGQTPPGQEIPISGALVSVATTAPPPIPEGVYCEPCIPTPEGGVLTGADGSFTLSVAPGNYTLTIQKGQFRLDQPVTLELGTPLTLQPSQTTLPSQWNPTAGMYMPRVAMAQGTNDNIEDILAKLGFGTLQGDAFGSPTGENGATEISIYQYAGTGPDSVEFLLRNMSELRKFHIIFFPCAVTMDDIDGLLQDQTILGNIRRYVQEGGKLYVTDWSGELADRAFPQQIELGGSGFFGAIDSVGTYDPVALTGTLTTVGNADGDLYDLDDGKAVDQGLHDWLGLQTGPTEGGGVEMYDPDRFVVTDLWNWINKLNPVQIGTDDMGQPVYDTPKPWVTGTGDGGVKPIAVTYQPTGCGKVLYTAFQTANSEHVGLYPQERVLLYLIMEIQTCTDNPIF